jgi:hypothetical protein
VELWQNGETDFYGVYLYEHANRGEDFIMHVLRKDKRAAQEIFDIIAILLK